MPRSVIARLGVPWWVAEYMYQKYMVNRGFTRVDLFLLLAFLRHYPKDRHIWQVVPNGIKKRYRHILRRRIKRTLDYLSSVVVEVC